MNTKHAPSFHVNHYTIMTSLIHVLNWLHNTCPICLVRNKKIVWRVVYLIQACIYCDKRVIRGWLLVRVCSVPGGQLCPQPTHMCEYESDGHGSVFGSK